MLGVEAVNRRLDCLASKDEACGLIIVEPRAPSLVGIEGPYGVEQPGRLRSEPVRGDHTAREGRWPRLVVARDDLPFADVGPEPLDLSEMHGEIGGGPSGTVFDGRFGGSLASGCGTRRHLEHGSELLVPVHAEP